MNVKGENVTFRFAAEKDCSLILSFIHQLAAYENICKAEGRGAVYL